MGVDPQSRNFIFEHIERLKGEGMTIIYTTHYMMEEAERLCDRVAIMDEGTIRALDTLKELVQLLGSGIVHARLKTKTPETARRSLEALPGALTVSQQAQSLQARDAQCLARSARARRMVLQGLVCWLLVAALARTEAQVGRLTVLLRLLCTRFIVRAQVAAHARVAHASCLGAP